ncbi:hypothetical protein [Methylomonas koyamae]|uniref:hypothetical protein n=1 Tax=Methylomonas koyamae TaxID=702114 RepID=UPI000A6D799E|nr:hypothetical protein [Methylomonas koyamae]
MAFNKIFKTSMLASALTLAAAQPAAAAWTGGDNSVELGTTITNAAFNGSTVGFSGNAALTYDAWGMQGAFTNFYLPTSAQSVTIDARSSAGNFPAFSIFRTNVAYSGDTVGQDTPAELTGQIHKFNSVGQAGDPGIIWLPAPTVSSKHWVTPARRRTTTSTPTAARSIPAPTTSVSTTCSKPASAAASASPAIRPLLPANVSPP